MNDLQLAFTGTQEGMSSRQRMAVVNHLSDLVSRLSVDPYSGDYLNSIILHHGDCIGADADMHNLSRTLFCEVCIHPPEKDSKRAFCQNYMHIEKPEPYLYRNRAIVDHSDLLYATPRLMHEELRSGTWTTIRYAATKKIPTTVFWPNGKWDIFPEGYDRCR